MKFAELLHKDHVLAKSSISDKEEAIRAMIELLRASGTIQDPSATMALVLERECEYPTGIGSGVAIPHTNCLQIREVAVALGTFPAGLDFGAEDGPAKLLILLLSPQGNSGGHLKLLARISRLARHELAGELLACNTVTELIQAVERVEQDFLEL